eukprot:TRINITY_DN11214_c0_g1_i1.p1 TRINITY_DN11214_c0_g1~~TRINITY_DN11214_c0_g1_i1.p1  ORF type:complete len:387 (+),score=79.52 TRINITY_DN11214_c0_g1_i1:169-1161(+)
MYRPPFIWGRSGNLQTMYSLIVRRSEPASFTRTNVLAEDGGTIALDWSPAPAESSIPIVLIIPGIAGSSTQHYVRNAVNEINNTLKWRAVVVNHRGCNCALTSRKLFSIGDSQDIKHAMDHIQSLAGDAPIYGIGYSMGANILGHYMGVSELQAGWVKFAAGISFSQSYDIHATSQYLPREKPIYSRLLNLKYKSVLKRHLLHFEQNLEKAIHLPTVFKTACLREFDKHFTAPLLGYKDVEDYYKAMSCAPHLKHISIPFLMVNASDDPLIPTLHHEPAIQAARAKSGIYFCRTKYGGHVMHATENFLPDRKAWMDVVMSQFFLFAHKQS